MDELNFNNLRHGLLSENKFRMLTKQKNINNKSATTEAAQSCRLLVSSD